MDKICEIKKHSIYLHMLTRTEKEFSKENMPLDFLRRAMAIGGKHTSPLKWELEDFIIREDFKGTIANGSKTPWEDSDTDKGYKKERSATHISHNRGFDSEIVIFEQRGSIQGYYKESGNKQYAPDSVAWCNLLLEYNFLEII